MVYRCREFRPYGIFTNGCSNSNTFSCATCALAFQHIPLQEQLVYFLQIVNDRREDLNGLIKIGRSKEPSFRAGYLSWEYGAQMQILGWTDGEEAEWHRRFREQQVFGEWFSPSQALLDAINFHCDPKKFGPRCRLPETPYLTGGGPMTLPKSERTVFALEVHP